MLGLGFEPVLTKMSNTSLEHRPDDVKMFHNKVQTVGYFKTNFARIESRLTFKDVCSYERISFQQSHNDQKTTNFCK